jgi:hypothetical protein
MTLIKISLCLFIFNCSAYCQINSVEYDLHKRLLFSKDKEAIEIVHRLDTQEFLNPTIFHFYDYLFIKTQSKDYIKYISLLRKAIKGGYIVGTKRYYNNIPELDSLVKKLLTLEFDTLKKYYAANFEDKKATRFFTSIYESDQIREHFYTIDRHDIVKTNDSHNIYMIHVFLDSNKNLNPLSINYDLYEDMATTLSHSFMNANDTSTNFSEMCNWLSYGYIVKMVKDRKIYGFHIARWIDAMFSFHNKTQVFGTMMKIDMEKNKVILGYPIINPKIVNQLRSDLNLYPLEEFSKIDKDFKY